MDAWIIQLAKHTILLSMRSQTILLLKYSMGVHRIPSCTYSSWREEKDRKEKKNDENDPILGWSRSTSCAARTRSSERCDLKWQESYSRSTLQQQKKHRGLMKCYLFSFQCQLNENLLQLFIHKVDAELLKSIFLKEQMKTQKTDR